MSKQKLWLWAINHFPSSKSDSFNSIFHRLWSRLKEDRCTVNTDYFTPRAERRLQPSEWTSMSTWDGNYASVLSTHTAPSPYNNFIGIQVTPNITLECGRRHSRGNVQMNPPASALSTFYCSLSASQRCSADAKIFQGRGNEGGGRQRGGKRH